MLTASQMLAYEMAHQANRDLLVAFIAIGLGLSMIYAVAVGHPRYSQLSSVKACQRAVGESMAACLVCLLGGLCLCIGGYLLNQFFVQRSSVASSQLNQNWLLESDSTL